MNKIQNLKYVGLFLLSMLLLGVMAPSSVYATNSSGNTGDPNGGGDFADRFSMNNGKLVDSQAGKNNTDNTFQAIFEKYRGVIAGVSGIVAISMMLFFIIQAFRLGSSAHNASERQKAIQGLIWLGIGTAITGSVSLFTGLFYGMLS